MLNRILILIALMSFGMSNLFISEAAEGSSNNKYLEIFNGGSEDVDLSAFSLSSCSNGCDTHGEWDYPNNVSFEAGTMLAAGDVYVVCHGSADDEIQAECDQTFTYLSNGDDVFALTEVASGNILDIIGTTGDDPGSGWQICDITNATKDHTIVRKSWVTEGTSDWGASSGSDGSDCQWVVYDQNEWAYLGFHDMDAGGAAHVIEAGMFYYSPDVLTIEMGETVIWDNVSGYHDVVAYDGSFELPACQAPCVIGEITFNEPGTYDYYCSVGNHEDQGMIGTIVVNGEIQLDCEDEAACNFMEEGECVYPEENYDCEGNCIVDTDCNGECGGDAVVDECGECGGNGSSCAEVSNLFFSEWAEGSSNNKYLEIYNAGEEAADLSFYAFPSVGNAPDVPGEYEYWNTFDEGASVAPGDVFVICHGSADETIIAECDQYHTYLSNGDDGVCLVFGGEENFEILDCIGNWDGDPGSGWDVAGVEAATKDHTIVRKPSVTDGTDYDWAASAGTNPDDSQWIVREQNNWDGLGFHDFGVVTCDDETACNYGEEGLCEYAEENYDCDGNCIVEEDCNGECGGDAVIDECGECGGDGSSCGEVSNLFISEAAEGSSNNKYLEIFNASGEDVDLGPYALSSCSNGCDVEGEFDYPNNVTFEPGTILAAGDVYVVCHGSADDAIQAECDQTFTYLSNGDDAFALTYGGTILDIIGTMGDDPGSGWQICDIENATKDHTIVRKSWVTEGTDDWGTSSGSDGSDCQWVVYDQNYWDDLGFHNMGDDGGECAVNGDVNGDGILNVLDVVAIVSAITSSTTEELECADMNGDDIINVLDVVQIVSTIVGGRTTDASEAILHKWDNHITIESDGYIGGVQMTLSHGSDFSIDLTDDAFVADYNTSDNSTILVIVVPEGDLLFTSSGNYEFEEVLIANSEELIPFSIIDESLLDIETPQVTEFNLSAAYPNPFNPSTTFELAIPEAGHVSVKVFDLSGSLVEVLANDFYTSDTYTMTWNANNLSSGMYVIHAEFNGKSISHNVTLIK